MTDAPAPGTLRVDLHVHSCHSGLNRTPALSMFKSRDCYSRPEEVYRTARARGMNLVTITDHDSIEGCVELLDRHPGAEDILVGEEIECQLAGTDLRLHVGAFGMTERLHREVQGLRRDVIEMAGFLRASGVALVLHHPFHFFRGQVPLRRYLGDLLPLVHAVEVRNATMSEGHNVLSGLVAGAATRGTTGGSDAHVLRHVAISYTEAPGRTAADFVESLKAGRTRGGGAHGTRALLAVEIYGVVFNYWASLLGFRCNGLTPLERLRGIALSVASLPFQFIPIVVTLAQKGGEDRRVERWRREWSRDEA